CLGPINVVNRLILRTSAMKAEAYRSDDDAHEALLERLWSDLLPGRRRSARITREWGDVGFQGQDPATDFRGMGLLG
ncbi:unnamed protein product, partial [Phaeothamnion confervicola]